LATIRILSVDDVRAAVNHDAALEIARQTLREQASGRAVLSSPSAMFLDATPFGGQQAKFKAAVVAHLDAAGIRLLAHPSPTRETYNYCAIYGMRDSRLLGLVPERWLSRLRTAAFGAAAIELLVNPGPLVVALFGTGAIAAEMVPFLARILDIQELRVNSRRAESTAAFVDRHASAVKFPIRGELDQVRAVKDADLVITLTEARAPLVFRHTLKSGAVLCSMGSHNEVDYGVLGEVQRLIVDDADFAVASGDGRAWIEQRHLTREAFGKRIDALACEVIAGKKPGRLAPSDVILALIQGMAIGDVAFAAHALRESERAGRGSVITLP
jgi:ornithine cyclodeaminase